MNKLKQLAEKVRYHPILAGTVMSPRFTRVCMVLAFCTALLSAQGAGEDTTDMENSARHWMTFFLLIGVICAVISLVFSALAIRGRNVVEGIVGVVAAIACLYVIAHARSWATSITGITV